MKKILLLLSSVFIAMTGAARDFSYTSDGQNITYTVVDESAKTCMTKGGDNVSGELYLPAHPKDGDTEFTLVKIGESSFANQSTLYFVDFPATIEEIGDSAFAGCKMLEFTSLPESLEKIGEYAFRNCGGQTSITLPRGIKELGKGAFREMLKLKKIVLFSDLETIPEELCAGCYALEAAYLPQQLKLIDNFAFLGAAMEEIILPATLEKIGVGAFAACVAGGINEVIEHCRYFEYVYWNSGCSEINDGKLTKVDIPQNLKEIDNCAFIGQPISRLKFNEGLKKIGHGAFQDNTLESLSLSSSIEDIGKNAFLPALIDNFGLHLYTLPNVTLPSSLKSLGVNAFGWATGFNIGMFDTGNGITELNTSLGHPLYLIIGENVTIMSPENIFIKTNDYQPNHISILQVKTKTPPQTTEEFPLTEDEIDKMIVIVKDGTKDLYLRNPYWRVFSDVIVEESEANVSIYVDGQYPITEEIRTQSGIMPSLVTHLTLKSGSTLSDTDWRLLRENMVSLLSVDLSGIKNTEIPDNAFEGKDLISSITLPRGLKKIGNHAFSGCSMINMPSIPESVTEIGEHAFDECNMLSISKLPDNLEVIQPYTFSSCNSLAFTELPENLKLIGEGAFAGCTSLESLDLSTTNIESISESAFANCSGLKQILLPSTLKILGGRAFENAGLEAIDLPALEFIDWAAFAGTKLRGINIPESLKELDFSIVADCSRLISINMPGSLDKVFSQEYNGNIGTPSSVMALTCAAINAPEAATGTFNGLSARRCGLAVPAQSYRSYLNAPQWGIFANLVNSLEVSIPEDLEVTAVDEEEYQQIVEDEALLEEAEAAAGESEDQNGDEPMRVKIRKASREAYVINGSNYARLFDGATFGSPKTTKGTRIFINVLKDAKLTAVYFNNEDVTGQLKDNSLVLPINANGSLRFECIPAGVADVAVDATEASTCTAYNMMGHVVYSGARADFESSVAPGLYIVKSGSKTTKVIVK